MSCAFPSISDGIKLGSSCSRLPLAFGMAPSQAVIGRIARTRIHVYSSNCSIFQVLQESYSNRETPMFS